MTSTANAKPHRLHKLVAAAPFPLSFSVFPFRCLSLSAFIIIFEIGKDHSHEMGGGHARAEKPHYCQRRLLL